MNYEEILKKKKRTKKLREKEISFSTRDQIINSIEILQEEKKIILNFKKFIKFLNEEKKEIFKKWFSKIFSKKFEKNLYLSFEKKIFLNLIKGFIDKYIICQKCGKKETILKNSQLICLSCNNRSSVV